MPHLQLYPCGLDIRLEGQEKDHQFYYYLHQSVWSSIQGIWNPYQPMWYGLGYSTKQRTCPCLRGRIRHKSHKDRTNTNLPSKIWHKDRTSTNLQREQKVRLSTLQEQIQHYPGAQLVTENKSCSDDAKKSSTSRWFNTVGQHNEKFSQEHTKSGREWGAPCTACRSGWVSMSQMRTWKPIYHTCMTETGTTFKQGCWITKATFCQADDPRNQSLHQDYQCE